MSLLFSGLPAGDLVKALYRGLLRREPDPAAQDKVVRLEAGEFTVEDLLREFLQSDEYVSLGGASHRFLNDQTQFGEFELLLKRWIALANPQPWVVDVGARGRERSNSYDLLRTFGWKGVLVEANPNLIPSITEDFDGLDIDLIQCAVSDYDGEATFFLGVNADVSSLNEGASAGWGPIVGQVTVPVRRLGPLLRERQVPEDFGLLSIDIEGEDIRVLNDLVSNFGYRPRWVIIEASYNFQTTSLDDQPFDETVRANYELVAQTAANLILELRPAPTA